MTRPHRLENGKKIYLTKFEIGARQAEERAWDDEHKASFYKEKRRDAYPDIGDQLDALWKTLAQLKADGVNLHPDALAMLDAVAAVKTNHPKGR